MGSVAAEGETRVPLIEDRLAVQVGVSREERGYLLPSGRQTVFHNRIHWAKFYMSKAGLIDSPRRGWAAAPERIDEDFFAKEE